MSENHSYTHKNANATISVIDVRTLAEFVDAHIEGSLNIPIQELESHFEKMKQLDNILLCCASGSRSELANFVLAKNNIKAANGGSWYNVNLYLRKNQFKQP
jgi:rhodanese-related sulfurtransferase